MYNYIFRWADVKFPICIDIITQLCYIVNRFRTEEKCFTETVKRFRFALVRILFLRRFFGILLYWILIYFPPPPALYFIAIFYATTRRLTLDIFYQ